MTSILVVALLTAASSLLLLTIYGYLIVRKIRNHRYNRQKAKWLKMQTHDIDNYLASGFGAEFFIPKKEYQFEAVEDRFSDFLVNFKWEDGFDPVRPYVENYFVQRYRRKLRSKQWSTRMNTLYFIDLFKLRAMEDDLLRHLESKRCTPEERYEIYILLAAFEYPGLIGLLKQSPEIPVFLLTELMAHLIHTDNLDEFAAAFHSFSSSWQGAILDIVRDKNLRSERLQELLEGLVGSDDQELRVRALKTLASLGYVSSPEVVIRMMEEGIASGRWDKPQAGGEKLMAARLMGSIRYPEFLPYLHRLVADQTYAIRSEAAKGIRQYRNGRELLLSITNTHGDRYARSIAQEWMERSLDYE